MWTLLLSLTKGAALSWRTWTLLAGIVVGLALLSLVRKSGKESAYTEQLQDWLKYQQERAKDRAVIQNMRNSDVRDQLRKRWSSR